MATATATGVLVDLARLPVYAVIDGTRLLRERPLIFVATGGCLVGTVLGIRWLRSIPEAVFARMVSALLVALGLWLIIGAVVELW